jgi:hypothetical protein
MPDKHTDSNLDDPMEVAIIPSIKEQKKATIFCIFLTVGICGYLNQFP